MSEQNVEVVRGLYELWNAGDLGLEFLAPDVEWDVSRWAPDLPAVAHGHDEMQNLTQSLVGMWDEVRFEPRQFYERGDRVVVDVAIHTRGRGSGVPVDVEVAHMFELHGGLVKRHVQYPKLNEALADADTWAMAEGNAERLDRLYTDCWAAANLDLIPEFLDPKIVWTAMESAPDFGIRRGHAEVRGYMNEWLEDFEVKSLPIEIAGTAPDGRLVCVLHQVGTSRRTGLEMDIRYAALVGFADDGRILEIHEFENVEQALEAAGLAPA
jgi:ketosteroid isomerase-like protein